MPPDRSPRRLDRSQLPAEFTADTVRGLGMRTARLLARPGNGILDAEEQRAFDAALREVMQGATERLGQTFGRGRPNGPGGPDAWRGPDVQDPELRRSYQRTQRRLEAQAARARLAFPQLTEGWAVDGPGAPVTDPTEPAPTDSDDVPVPRDANGHPEDTNSGTESDPTDPTNSDDAVPTETDDDVSLGTFEAEIAQTSDMMDVLQQIATIQQQQLEQQRSKVLGETRSIFFGLAVSVAVIVAGIAPLVEASPRERRLILLWTAVVCVVAGGVYAALRAIQSRAD